MYSNSTYTDQEAGSSSVPRSTPQSRVFRRRRSAVVSKCLLSLLENLIIGETKGLNLSLMTRFGVGYLL